MRSLSSSKPSTTEELLELVAQEEVEGRICNALGEDDGACDDVGTSQVLNEEAPVHTNPHHEEDAGVQIAMEYIATHVVKTEEETAKRGAFFLFCKNMTEARPPRSHAG
ncbi:hypothetical protein JZ751_014369 [Albula glossodonta]|uniref:Uncharacterized protein n=1 Tax=Albula glossodonta TaxID=121402 RepID=A0A8T2P164_9TELE|nr:hypothetical protein JZ751_014369 [Albula glossodonta]